MCGRSKPGRYTPCLSGQGPAFTCAVSVLPIATGLLKRGRGSAEGHTMLLRRGWRDLVGQAGEVGV